MPALACAAEGYDSFVVVDARGRMEPEPSAATVTRLAQAGVALVTTRVIVLEMMADNAHPRASSPVALSVHSALGLLLVVTGISALARAILARRPALIVTSAAGLAAITGAGFSGAAFVGNGRDAASLAMALFTAVAMLSYLASVFILGSARACPRYRQIAPSPAPCTSVWNCCVGAAETGRRAP